MEPTRTTCALTPLPAEIGTRIELIPTGTFKTADARPAFRLEDAARVIAASLRAAPGGVLPIDFDHRSFEHRDSRAAGWITGMEVEGERVMASVDWTPDGRRALDERAYRFVSPVFKNMPDGRVVLIEGAGLVNVPALPQLRQLASKDFIAMDPIQKIAALLGVAPDQPDEIEARVSALLGAETQLASITKAAGVEGDDVATQVCSRLKAADRAGEPDPAAFVPMASFQSVQRQLASLQEAVNGDRVEAALEGARADGKLTADLEAWARQLASKDLEQFSAWAAAAPQLVAPGRHLAGRQPPAKTDALTSEDRQVMARTGVSEAAFLATRHGKAA